MRTRERKGSKVSEEVRGHRERSLVFISTQSIRLEPRVHGQQQASKGVYTVVSERREEGLAGKNYVRCGD